jgi:hypothetical protein
LFDQIREIGRQPGLLKALLKQPGRIDVGRRWDWDVRPMFVLRWNRCSGGQ